MNTNFLMHYRNRCSLICSLFLLFLLPLTHQISAQGESRESYAARAAMYCQEKDYEKAILYSDSSVLATESADAYTWYVRGFIFKESYKSGLQGAAEYRDRAVEALLHCKEILTGSDAYNPDVVLKYLATTYYNDALVSADRAIDAAESQSDVYFEKYRHLMTVVSPEYNTAGASAEYYMTKAQRLYGLWMENSCNHELVKKSEEAYYKALEFEPQNCDCFYNLAITSYNRGLMQMKAETSGGRCETDVNVTACLEKSLELLMNADAHCPSRMDICQALINVNKALDRPDVAAGYTRLLEELKQSKN